MKILISIGTLGLGGAEKQAVWLANSLSAIHEVTLLTYHGGVREKDLNAKVIWKTIYEIQYEEKDENLNSRKLVIEEDLTPGSETAGSECDSVTSISKLTLLEEKVKTFFKNFPLILKILKYFYIRIMPLIQIVRSRLRLAFQSLTNQLYVFISARRIVNETRPDLIITFLFHDTLNVGLAGLTQLNRPKLIVGRRSPIGYGDSSRKYSHRLALKIIYKFSDLAVSNSGGNLETARHDGLMDNKIKLIHNFVNKNESKMRLNESHNTHLICVSNFYDYKNHLNLIKALGEIKNQFDFRVTFLGEGPLSSEMNSLAKSLNLAADFFSHEDQAVISEFKVDFLLLPSYFEGSSNALLESLSQGIPAIVTNVGLVPELVAMGAPLMVSGGTDFKSLQIALFEGLSHKHELKVQALNFRSTIVNEFGEDKILQDWLQIIEKI